MKLLYPTSLELDVDSFKGFATTYHAYNVKELIPEDLIDAEILITWTNTAENLKDAAARMKNIKWIQSLAAGPNDVFSAGFSKSITVTTGSSLHDYTVAEHTLALLLNAARRFFEMRDFQVQAKWPQHLGGPQPDRPKGKFTSLRGANVLIWGFGNIAKTLTPHLVSLGSTVTGVARSAGINYGVQVIDETQLDEQLRKTDALVMILPGSDSTMNVLNKERLALLPNHAWVVNVGRGTSIDEEALADALESGQIGGAALDVFVKEPLQQESRLWKTPNTIISPHAAGGRPQGSEGLIAENLRRFMAGQELKNVA